MSMGRKPLPLEQRRTVNRMVAFNQAEYDTLQSVIRSLGYETDAAAIRDLALNRQLPAPVVIPEVNVEIIRKLEQMFDDVSSISAYLEEEEGVEVDPALMVGICRQLAAIQASVAGVETPYDS